MRNKLTVTWVAALVVALGVLAGCGSGDESSRGGSDDTIRIGSIQPLSGPLAVFGTFAADGTKMAVDYVNRTGGVDGKQVEVVQADAPTVQDARTQAQRLARTEGIPIITGTASSSLAIVAASTATRFGAFYLEGSSASSDITKSSKPYSLKVPWTVQDLVDRIPDLVYAFFAKQLGKDPSELRVAMIREDGDFGTGIDALLPPALEKAGLPPLVANEAYTASTIQDFSPIIQRLKRADPDVVIAGSYVNDVQLFVRQAAQQGLDVKAIVGTSGGLADGQLPDKLSPDLLNGLYVLDSNPNLTAGLTKEGKEVVDAFLAAYRKKYGDGPVVSHTAQTFTATYLLLRHILPGIDPTDRDAILKKAMSLDMPLGSFPLGFGAKFGAEDDPVHPHSNEATLIVLNQWQNGTIESVAPDDFADAKPVDWKPNR